MIQFQTSGGVVVRLHVEAGLDEDAVLRLLLLAAPEQYIWLPTVLPNKPEDIK